MTKPVLIWNKYEGKSIYIYAHLEMLGRKVDYKMCSTWVVSVFLAMSEAFKSACICAYLVVAAAGLSCFKS